jgi:hypothetical protein
MSRPVRRATPALLMVYSISYWVGIVYRDASAEPACHATGSVAFYYFGLENNPAPSRVPNKESSCMAG